MFISLALISIIGYIIMYKTKEEAKKAEVKPTPARSYLVAFLED